MNTILFRLKKHEGKVKYSVPAMKTVYKNLLDSLEEGQEIEVFASMVASRKGTLAQINKVHKCIRDLASHTGETFENIKLIIKEKSGLMIISNEDSTVVEKSFADCTSEELNLAIQAAIVIGEQAGVNLY